MSKTFTINILTVDEPNFNGRIYPRAVVEEAISKAKDPLPGTIGMPLDEDVPEEEVSHQVSNLRLEDGRLMGTVTILGTPKGKILEGMIDADFRTAGTGMISISENGHTVVTDFVLKSINALPKGTGA